MWLDEHYPLFGERDGLLNVRAEGRHLIEPLTRFGLVFSLAGETDPQRRFAWTTKVEPIYREAEYLSPDESSFVQIANDAISKMDDDMANNLKAWKNAGDDELAIRRFKVETSVNYAVAKYAIDKLL